MKKAAIYDPYLDTLGGGERYCLTVAEILLKNGYQVDLFWSGDQELISKAKDRFNLDIENIKLVPDIFHLYPSNIDLIDDTSSLKSISVNQPQDYDAISKLKTIFNRLKKLSRYDLIFYLSDGSLPFLFSKINLLHVQVPFNHLPNNPFDKILRKVKINNYRHIICNSEFTQKFTKKSLPEKTTVLYPPVDVEKFSPAKNKENIILSVGRFDNVLNAKKQDVLIYAFNKLTKLYPNHGWKLVLAGGSLENPDKNYYLKCLKEMAKNQNVDFIINPNFNQLCQLYSLSKIYWHAAGHEVDQENHPEKTEHFGMTVVEAMASGAVPVVVAKGGLSEIVENDKNGYLWNNISELVSKTHSLMSSSQILDKLSKNALEYSQNFSKLKFTNKFIKLIS
jgi:glycosyltransferase involved in cell wall biosynthesis